ncbi:hypothetical protein NQ317_007333 [Molorchus minor]|uniref:Uncharacterized protein n=1 Tax=Molorchus minor TaxID=1323400 RepID=A0ABQ9J9F2_9CUCU|nr:hypothetical protein NQ317_007333 [Molorchus minor]
MTMYVKDLETAYSFVVFSQFIASIIVICISLLQLSIVSGAILDDVSLDGTFHVHYTNGNFFYTAITEPNCTKSCKKRSNSVINSIYMSDWYNFDDKSKKALLTLMERAKRPMKMTAGKLLDLSLDTFATGIYKRNFRPANAEELWKVIQNAWEELREDQNYSQNLIESMPRRLDAVLEANGDMTKYHDPF